jgi:hypothetical protein
MITIIEKNNLKKDGEIVNSRLIKYNDEIGLKNNIKKSI